MTNHTNQIISMYHRNHSVHHGSTRRAAKKRNVNSIELSENMYPDKLKTHYSYFINTIKNTKRSNQHGL